MFTMKYTSPRWGVMVKAKYPNGWVRVDNTNSCYLQDTSSEPFESGVCVYTTYLLMSYLSKILFVDVENMIDAEQLYIQLTINKDLFDISQSTRRHLGRFLRMLCFWYNIPDDALNYHIIKSAVSSMLGYDMVTVRPNGITTDGKRYTIVLDALSDDEINESILLPEVLEPYIDIT